MTILHLISTFPPLTETFVLREIRQLRKLGLNVIIGQLRPLHQTPPAKGFEDLSPLVNGAGWFSLEMLKGLAFFTLRKPRQLAECLRIVLPSFGQPQHFVKMLYILLSSMRLGYSLQNVPIDFVRADFLHTQALAARFLKSLLGVPYGITAYTVVVYYKLAILEEIIREAAFLVADTWQTKSFLLSMGVSPNKVHLIRNGVPLEEFPPHRRPTVAGSPVILGVGSLIPKKGFDVLLRACAILHERGLQFRCVIIGDGAERERLGILKKDLGVDGNVKMLGYRTLTELRDWYYRAAVLVMPSVVSLTGETDGLPTVVIEALASGLPVVGTETAAIPELVQDGVNGFLVESNAPRPLADRIQVLLERPDLREKFGCEGRRRVEQDFNLDRKVEAVRDLIVGHVPSKSLSDIGHPLAQLAR
ncbi:MAG: glycosyltransferase [Candidatus Acidiferrum sp.]|jgi:glycosyltransferase involved in cell wall biosynthesis